MNKAMIILQKAVATCYNVEIPFVKIDYIDNDDSMVKVEVEFSADNIFIGTNGFMRNEKYNNFILTFDFLKTDLYDFLVWVE
jgi:hypothetical protein